MLWLASSGASMRRTAGCPRQHARGRGWPLCAAGPTKVV